MCSERLRNRVPSARHVATGRLNGYKLAFHKRSSKDGSAKADALFTGVKADVVWGVLFEVDPEEKRALDSAEGLHFGYEEKTVIVETASGNVTAVMYYATDIDETLLPYSWYVRHAVIGAREHLLPEPYVAAIEQTPQVEDPDRERDATERAIGSTAASGS